MATNNNNWSNGTYNSRYSSLYDGKTNIQDLQALRAGLSNKEEQVVSHIGAYHMIGKDEWEPQRNNNFEVHIFGLDNLFYIDTDTKVDQGMAEEVLTLSAVSVGALNISMSPIEIPYGNTKVKYAGLPDVQNATITYNDYIGKNTERVLTAWFGIVFNPKTEVIGRASQYKKPAVLIETAPDGTHSRMWQLDGCWPSSLELGQYDYNGGGSVRQISVTLTYDRMVPMDDGNFTEGVGFGLKQYISR